MNIQLSQFLLGTLFLTLIFLHLTKKNFLAAVAYGIQSLAITAIFFNSFWQTKEILLLLVVIFTLIVKVIWAPVFFIGLIRRNTLAFSVSTFLNAPLTIAVIAILTFLAHSAKLSPLTNIVPGNQALLNVALSAIFLSLFLIVNRKGALSQITGVLSLENSIVAFVVLAGLESSSGLQIGVIFNIFVWVIIATIFMSMIYKHFGSLNVEAMKNLKD